MPGKRSRDFSEMTIFVRTLVSWNETAGWFCMKAAYIVRAIM